MQSSGLLTDAISNQRRSEQRRWFVISILFVVLLASFVLDVATGPSLLNIKEVANALLHLVGFNTPVDPTTEVIVTNLRLPIAIMAVIVGGVLGVGGAEMQTLLNNPMASPYTLGMAAAAGFGAAMTLYVGSGLFVCASDHAAHQFRATYFGWYRLTVFIPIPIILGAVHFITGVESANSFLAVWQFI